MGKITGLWLAGLMLLAAAVVPMPSVAGAGVAAASNHETATAEGPDVQIRDTAVIDTRADTGQQSTPELELWATFENTGDEAGTAELRVAVGGQAVTVTGTDEVRVDPGTTRNVTTTYALETGDGAIEDGEHEVTVNGETAGTIVVGEPNITVTEHAWNATTVAQGGAVELTVTAENTGTLSGQRTVSTTVDGQTVGGVPFALEPGESETETYVYTFDEAGTFDFGTTVATRSITVESQGDGGGARAGPPDVRIRNASLRDTQADAGQQSTPELELQATFENAGDRAGKADITVRVGGREVTVIGADEVTVPPRKARTVTTTYVLETDDGAIENGEHEVTVNGEPAGTLTVGQSNVTVTDHAWNATTVVQGGAVELTVTAENTGTLSGQRDVPATVNGQPVDALSFALDPGASGTDTYVYRFDESGTFVFGTAAETRTITVERPAAFEVTDRSLSSTAVSEGDSVDVTATVTNVGDRAGSYRLPLTVADREAGAAEVTLGPGESERVSLAHSFNALGLYPVNLDGERVGTVRVSEPAVFETTRVSINRTTVATGAPIAVTATVRNEGDEEGTEDVRLQEDGNTIDTRSVTLAGGARTNVTFAPSFSTTGQRDIAVDNQFGASVNVFEPATFDISNARVDSDTVTENGSVEISATVTNTGDREGTYNATFSVASAAVATQEVTLAGGESTEISSRYTFTDSGNYAVDVAGERAGTVTVKEPAEFTTTAIELNQTAVRAGDAVRVDVTVANTGDQRGTSPVRLQANDAVLNTTNVTLAGGESTEVTFVRVFDSGGEYNVSANGVAGGTVAVTQPATFVVEDAKLSSGSVDEGDSVEVTATVANVGTEPGNYTAELTEGDQVLKSRSIGPIAGGQTETVTFSIAFDSEGDRSLAIGGVSAGTLSVEAESGGGGGGGGGGGDGGSGLGGADEETGTETETGGGAEPPAISQSRTGGGVTVQVTETATGSTVAQPLNLSGPSATAPAFTLTELSLDVSSGSGGFNATFIGLHATPNGVPAVEDAGVRGYVTVTSGADAPDVGRANYTLSVNDSALPANGSLAGVQVLGYHNGTWTRLPTTVDATNRTVRATAPALGPIAVVSPVADESTPTATTPVASATPAELAVTRASLTADWVRAGFNTTARAQVENPTTETVEQTLTVTVDGDAVASETVRLGPGEQTTVSIEFEAVEGTVAVSGVEAGDLRVGADDTGSDSLGEGGGAEADETAAASGPGFTPLAAVVALTLAVGLVYLRRRW